MIVEAAHRSGGLLAPRIGALPPPERDRGWGHSTVPPRRRAAGCRFVRYPLTEHPAIRYRAFPGHRTLREQMRSDRLRRREFLTLVGGTAAAWPLAARAQQPARMRRIGLLMSTAADDPESQRRLVAFVQGLHQAGWT